jgi:hypothetical protein
MRESIVYTETQHDGPAGSYRSFLVRCQREAGALPENGEQDAPPWRFMVMEVGGPQRWRAITSLEELMSFFRNNLGM